MLVLKKKVTQSTDGTQLYIEFFNATGNYDASTNPGGFGTPNPARNTLAMVFYGNFKRVSGDVLAIPLAHDPITVSSYTLDIVGLNGVLDYFIYAIPIFNPIGTYVDGDIVYDNQATPFIKKRVSGVWVPIQPADVANQTIVVQTEGVAFPIPEMAAYRNDLNASRMSQLQLKIDEGDNADWEDYYLTRDGFDYVDGMLDAATKDFCAAAYAPAQVKLEKVEKYATEHPIEQ
jgi:hypothetical protein